MRVSYLSVFLLGFAVLMFWNVSSGYAEIYLYEDFESFSDGDDIVEKGDFWELLDGAQAPGHGVNRGSSYRTSELRSSG